MTSDVITAIAELRSRVTSERLAQRGVGFVPTMGALHAGHRRLFDIARAECTVVVVSIFVNPLQFDRPDDLEKYPRSLTADVELCSAACVDVVFAPTVEEMYPAPLDCTVDVGRVAEHLCGRFRPGHFRGVATVVTKLFQIVQPDRAYFGEKDAQQLAVIRRLVEDLNIPVQIVGVPTVRDADGLALSSRNARLSAEQRRVAPVLFDALKLAAVQVAEGVTEAPKIREAAHALIDRQPAVRLEYLEIVEPREMQPVEQITGPVIAAGAIWLDGTRLIDNVICVPP